MTLFTGVNPMLGTLITITHKEKVSSVASHPNAPASSVGRESEGHVSHRPTSIDTKRQKYRGSSVGCGEGISFVYYVIRVVIRVV